MRYSVRAITLLGGDDAGVSGREELARLASGAARRGFAIARDLLGDPIEAEDAVQESLARACAGVGRLRDRAALAAGARARFEARRRRAVAAVTAVTASAVAGVAVAMLVIVGGPGTSDRSRGAKRAAPAVVTSPAPARAAERPAPRDPEPEVTPVHHVWSAIPPVPVRARWGWIEKPIASTVLLAPHAMPVQEVPR